METDLEKLVFYVVMGEDGFYTFSDPWRDLARQLGWLNYCGFTLIGIDGINGFRINEEEKKHAR
jgi:hypothetical protein